MIAKVKCTYVDTYKFESQQMKSLYSQFRGKGEVVGYLTGDSRVYQNKLYLEVKTSNTIFWVKKVAVNITEDNNSSNNNYQPKKGGVNKGLLLLASIFLLND